MEEFFNLLITSDKLITVIMTTICMILVTSNFFFYKPSKGITYAICGYSLLVSFIPKLFLQLNDPVYAFVLLMVITFLYWLLCNDTMEERSKIMKKYKISNGVSHSEKGYILIEQPHRSKRKVWIAGSDADLIVLTNAKIEQCRDDWPTVTTPEQALDYISHDLSTLQVLRRTDMTQEMLDNDEDIAYQAFVLNWANEEKTKGE